MNTIQGDLRGDKPTMVCVQVGGALPPYLPPIPEDLDWLCEYGEGSDINIYFRGHMTGSVTIHFQEDIVMEIEHHTRKRMRKRK